MEPSKIFTRIIEVFCSHFDFDFDLKRFFSSDDKFYADSFGSGLLLRGVLLHFLRRFDEAHQAFDQILDMFVDQKRNDRNSNEFVFFFLQDETIR